MRCSRNAFTLVELLVVVAIIGILVALMIPAVQSAREAARRIHCANNLKQIALAVIQYSGANREHLPAMYRTFHTAAGISPAPCRDESRPQSFGWRSSLLPFIEEQAIYDAIDFTYAVQAIANGPAVGTTLPLFQCPSTPGSPRTQEAFGRARVATGFYDYSVVASPVWIDRSTLLPSPFEGIRSVRRDGTSQKHNYGKLADRLYEAGLCASQISRGPAKLVWVEDGLSKTAMAIETAWRPYAVQLHFDPPTRGELIFYPYSWANAAGGGSPSSLVGINISNEQGRFAFHPAGVNNAMLDGSVGFLSESLDLSILKAMDTRANGEPLSDL